LNKIKKGYCLLILILIIAVFEIPIIFASIQFGNGIIYRTSGGGSILFEKDFYASRCYFSNGLLYFKEFSYDNNGIWPLIGFSCETSSANMTINKVNSKEISYIVNAPTGINSTTYAFVGTKKKPDEVKGALSWNYDKNTETVKVIAEHYSPTLITIEWKQKVVSNFIITVFPVYEMMGVVLIVMVSYLIMGAINGNVDAKFVLDIFKVALISVISVWVLSYFLRF